MILANSNPATIMTDPDFADRTYIEPLTPDVLARIIERERPDAVLPTLGGQTGLNLAMALYERGLVGVPGHAGADRRQRRGHRHRRGPRAVQGGHGRDRAGACRPAASPTPSTRRGPSSSRSGCRSSSARPTSSAGGAPASPRPSSELGAAWRPPAWTPARSREILIEASIVGLEGVRAGGHAGPGRQLRRDLLDRERRPDGRPHRRLDHRGAGPDPVRRRVPADARRRLRLHPPGRRRDRWLQRAVRASTRPTATRSSSR